MWSYFYLELVLRFPNLSGKEIIKKAIKTIEEKDGLFKFISHIGAYVESSEKELQKLLPTFSFLKISNERTLTKEEIDKLSNEEMFDMLTAYGNIRNWFNDEMKKIVEERSKRLKINPPEARKKRQPIKKQTGKGMVSSCCTDLDLEGAGNAWIESLKKWNKDQVFREELWGIPKKGSEEYKEVRDAMESKK